jgi:hypothetical protein
MQIRMIETYEGECSCQAIFTGPDAEDVIRQWSEHDKSGEHEVLHALTESEEGSQAMG